MSILIAGGAGFIGSHLIDELLKINETVICVDNFVLGNINMISHNLSNPNFLFYEIDICDKSKLGNLFMEHKFTRVYHLAANSDIQSGGYDPSIDFNNSFMTTMILLDIMREYEVKEFLFASSSAIYGEKNELLSENTGNLQPISYYGASKLASEAFISAYASMNSMRANIIRFPNVVGPRLTHGVVYDFINKLRRNKNELEILGDGRQEKPYLYVIDLVEAIMLMQYEKELDIYNVGVETVTTVNSIANIVCEVMGLSDVNYSYTGGTSGWQGDVPKFQYDLSKIHSIGWKAKYSSDEAVQLAARSMI